MSIDSDKISGQIACLDTDNMLATLISTKGYHCEVWRSIGNIVTSEGRIPLDFVIKKFRRPCSIKEIELYHKQYRLLKSKLDDLIPDALFVITTIDDEISVVVIAETTLPWFNIANPVNQREAIPMLRSLPRAQSQLTRFIDAAREWRESDDCRIIDIYGLDNLVLDKNREIKYLDSFSVFFHEDLLYLTDEVDQGLKEKIDLSLQRLEYLEYVLQESRKKL